MAIILVAGITLFCYQGLTWIGTAKWPHITMLTPLTFIPFLQEWVAHPGQFTTLHQILDYIPLWTFLLVLGFAVFLKKL